MHCMTIEEARPNVDNEYFKKKVCTIRYNKLMREVECEK